MNKLNHIHSHTNDRPENGHNSLVPDPLEWLKEHRFLAGVLDNVLSLNPDHFWQSVGLEEAEVSSTEMAPRNYSELYWQSVKRAATM